MKYSSMLRALLVTSGLIGIGVGSAMLLSPVAFHATVGIELGNDSSLLNEMRASGGAVLGGGLLILSGAFAAMLRLTAVIMAMTLYLSYGLARMLSMLLDGMPSATLVAVCALELSMGLACLVALANFRRLGDA